ncbi:TPA: replication/maintenance protein RepL, partial [Bacillus cereus]|nr:replication/maintenance protein RepL [Bacillus cereus]HDR8500040.1 replication/maintenance protein RepL [Bacillus cereus]HDR8511698.1 replication/maintenance protein RepL [Bacillus cereus]HDR8535447.1 replication/maintenance protein RepL [Bacillus cereus]
MNVINVEERDANFHKLWLGHIIQSLDLIGN